MDRQIYPRPELLTYEGILKEIDRNLQGVQQWLEHDDQLLRAAEYRIAAKTLIELLEVYNCGSVGGYDKDQPPYQTIQDRYNWLVNHNRVYNI